MPALGFAQKKKVKKPTAVRSLVWKSGERLKARYDEAGLDATYQLIEGAGHGGPQYRDKERSKLILDMLKKTLRPAK
ncbi:uncharacterized protein METZ01_LOCUS250595 [marine metagenome]|uniref:Peptidase S9 prolyl oligopeptidase catalytic domain-containing protein n=1 Tax=marine metagenome TaxID=408172 RepID=A0A382IGG1_9ZZZZ